MTLAGRMLPGLGFAILLRYLPVKRNLHYLAMGFGLTAMLTVLYSYVTGLGGAVAGIIGTLPKDVAEKIESGIKRGKKHSIVMVAEGCMSGHECAEQLTKYINVDARVSVLGHIQRGGSPTARDRVLASRMGAHAVKLLKQGIGGVAVGIRNEKMVENPILGTAEEGALFSLTADGKIVVNNPHKADLELSSLNKSLS